MPTFFFSSAYMSKTLVSPNVKDANGSVFLPIIKSKMLVSPNVKDTSGSVFRHMSYVSGYFLLSVRQQHLTTEFHLHVLAI